MSNCLDTNLDTISTETDSYTISVYRSLDKNHMSNCLITNLSNLSNCLITDLETISTDIDSFSISDDRSLDKNHMSNCLETNLETISTDDSEIFSSVKRQEWISLSLFTSRPNPDHLVIQQ